MADDLADLIEEGRELEAVFDEAQNYGTGRAIGALVDAVEMQTGRVVSARSVAIALEQECAVLADTLALLTHEYEHEPNVHGYCRSCYSRADDLRHRTPNWLRKRYGLGV